MFKALFSATLLITLVVNIIFLFATKDKPPDPSTSSISFEPLPSAESISIQRRLFSRSNDQYDYAVAANETAISDIEPTSSSGNFTSIVTSTRNTKEKVDRRDVVSPRKEHDRLRNPGQRVHNNQQLSEANNGISSEFSNNQAYDNRLEVRQINDQSRFLPSQHHNESSVGRDRPSTINIRVKSSKNHVFVSVNDLIIYESKSSKRTEGRQVDPLGEAIMGTVDVDSGGSDGRGIHVVVLNEYQGYVMAKRVFDTYTAGQDEELCYFINMVRDGRILIFAVKDEASFKMGPNSPARDLLRRLGSKHIMKLGWRDMWSFIVRKSTLLETDQKIGQSRAKQRSSNLNLGESLMKSSKFTEWAIAVILDSKVQLIETDHRLLEANGYDPTSLACPWSSSGRDEDRRRLRFCSRIEGFERVCDCQYPAKINFNPLEVNKWSLKDVPIVVMASNRAQYLYRMLRSLMAADGFNRSMATVFIDGFYEDPLLVSQLFDLRAVQQRPLSTRGARISHHYKSSLTATFEMFPHAEFAIIFEEDLDIAQDALVFFNQTLELLKRDPSLYCASAWNDLGYESSVGDSRLLYRVETMPGLGWMLSRDLYKRELEPNWPPFDRAHDWDMWIRTAAVRKNRECIIPDISRTFHFGSKGTNINSYFQRQYFSKHAFIPISERQTLFRDLHKSLREEYESHIEQLLARAQVHLPSVGQNSSEYLCSLANPLATSTDIGSPPVYDRQLEQRATDSVIYIEMIDEHDYSNWLKLARCWHIWDLDARGQHKSMWRLFLSGRPVFVVGVPASPYAKFKPPHLRPFAL